MALEQDLKIGSCLKKTSPQTGEDGGEKEWITFFF